MIQVVDILSKLSESVRKLGEVKTTASLYETIFMIIREVFDCDKAAVLLKKNKDETVTVVAKTVQYTDLDMGESIRIGEGIKGRALSTKEIQMASATISTENGQEGADACEAAIPVMDSANEVLGVISMMGKGHCFDNALGPILSILGDMIAMGVANLRSRSDVDERARRLAVISKTIQTVASDDVDQQTLLQKLLALTKSALNPDGCSVQLYSDDRTHLVVACAIGIQENFLGLRIPCNCGVFGVALETRRPSLVPNLADSKAPERSPLAADYLSELAVPLVYKNNVLGVLHLGHRQAGVFDQTDLLTASIMADCVAEGLGASQSISVAGDKSAYRDEEMGLLSTTIREASSCSGFEEIFSEVFPQSVSFLRLKRAVILTPYAIQSHFKVSHVFGYAPSTVGRQIPLEHSLTGEAYRTARTVYSLNGRITAESAIAETSMPVKAAFPMMMAKEVVGVLFVESESPLDPYHIETLETIVGHLSPFFMIEQLKKD